MGYASAVYIYTVYNEHMFYNQSDYTYLISRNRLFAHIDFRIVFNSYWFLRKLQVKTNDNTPYMCGWFLLNFLNKVASSAVWNLSDFFRLSEPVKKFVEFLTIFIVLILYKMVHIYVLHSVKVILFLPNIIRHSSDNWVWSLS